MKKMFKKILCLVIILSMILSSAISVSAGIHDMDKFQNDFNFLRDVIIFVNTLYQYDVDQDKIIQSLYDGYFDILDDYSEYYTPEEYQKFFETVAGKFAGIGVQITAETSKDKFIISALLPKTPAEKSGLEVGDEIFSVSGKEVKGLSLSEVSSLIKGDVGTNVNLCVIRDNQKFNFSITRQYIELLSVEHSILNGDLGYLKIVEFNENTPSQVDEALKEFDSKNVKDIIIDVRNNLGGSVDSVVSILNNFVTAGPLFYVNSKVSGEYSRDSEALSTKYNVCVLVNGLSASASEIFAGAIQDRGFGKIIGSQTYGKGVMQSLYPLKSGSAVKFTTAEYLTPNKHIVNGVGITPDIVVDNPIGKPKADISKYPKLTKERKARLNDIGLDVLGAEMILETLGYKVGKPDGILDTTTFNQIMKFQKDTGLFPYGVLDFSTQDMLTNALLTYAIPEIEDMQLKAAIKHMGR